MSGAACTGLGDGAVAGPATLASRSLALAVQFLRGELDVRAVGSCARHSRLTRASPILAGTDDTLPPTPGHTCYVYALCDICCFYITCALTGRSRDRSALARLGEPNLLGRSGCAADFNKRVRPCKTQGRERSPTPWPPFGDGLVPPAHAKPNRATEGEGR